MYLLYNKTLEKYLKHPVTKEIWCTEDPKEAQELLEEVKNYVKSIGVPEIADKLTIIEIEYENL